MADKPRERCTKCNRAAQSLYILVRKKRIRIGWYCTHCKNVMLEG